MPTRAGALLWTDSPLVSAQPCSSHRLPRPTPLLISPPCISETFLFKVFSSSLALALNNRFSSSEWSANSFSYSSTIAQLCSLLSAILIFSDKHQWVFLPSLMSVRTFFTAEVGELRCGVSGLNLPCTCWLNLYRFLWLILNDGFSWDAFSSPNDHRQTPFPPCDNAYHAPTVKRAHFPSNSLCSTDRKYTCYNIPTPMYPWVHYSSYF